MTIRAVTFHGPEDVRVESRPDPTPPTDGVVLRVDRAAICGSDLHLYHGSMPVDPASRSGTSSWARSSSRGAACATSPSATRCCVRE